MTKKTIYDYIKIPTKIPKLKFSQLPIKTYIITYNKQFKNQNLITPLTKNINNTSKTTNNTNTILNKTYLKIKKYHNYFTSYLPKTQKNSAITTPLKTTAPIVNNNITLKLTNKTNNYDLNNHISSSVNFLNTSLYNKNTKTTYTPKTLITINKSINITTNPTKSSIITNLTNTTTTTINTLQLTFQTQKILKLNTHNKTKYTKIIHSHYKIINPNNKIQKPKYLNKKKIPININQILQTSSTDTTSPQSYTKTYSLTTNSKKNFTKSFTKHKIILRLLTIKQNHNYQQKLERY